MTPTTVAASPRGTEAAYAQLRALAVADLEGWCRYVAGRPAEGRHVLELARPRGRNVYRTLERGEAFWWALGLGDGCGQGQLVDAVLAEPVPGLVSTADAAAMMAAVDRWGNRTGPAMSAEGIKHNITSTRLYPLYGAQRFRYLFTAQTDAERLAREVAQLERLAHLAASEGNERAARTYQSQLAQAQPMAERAHLAWLDLRHTLPPNTPIDAVAVDVRPLASPSPLPIRAQGAGEAQVQALRIGDRRGWFVYDHPGDGLFTVTVTDAGGAPVEREVPTEGVLPWVLGVADWNNAAHLVAYRAGLGG